uniref:Uncharacterized protein n=1 Tax=Aegilops tauschii subsp. strangulata TaxID=200361 RepID=A0A453SK92_AEGTS
MQPGLLARRNLSCAKCNCFHFAETLPLVSLLWLVSIVCLFLTPGLPNRSLVAPRRAERDLAMVAGKPSSDQPETLELLLHGRRWRGTRERIKLDTPPLRAAAAC